MKAVEKGQNAAIACATMVSVLTGNWLVLVATVAAVVYTMLISPACRPQRRELARVEIREAQELLACYDYGGCQWAGDGCKGKPLVLGSGKGCAHTAPTQRPTRSERQLLGRLADQGK